MGSLSDSALSLEKMCHNVISRRKPRNLTGRVIPKPTFAWVRDLTAGKILRFTQDDLLLQVRFLLRLSPGPK